MRGIVILTLNKDSEPRVDIQFPENICDELQISTSGLLSLFEQHKTVKTGPNYIEMQIKRNVSVASFFTGHSNRSFLGKPDHSITIFLSDDDILPKTFEGQVRRIAFELLPKRQEPDFYEQFILYFELLKKGELDPHFQQMVELTQDLSSKKERIDDLAKKVSILVSDRSDHLKNVEALKNEINGLYTKMDDWSAQMAELNEYNASLTMKIKDFNKSSKTQTQQLQQKEDQIVKLRNAMKDTGEIEAGAEKILEEIRRIKTENENLTNKIERLNETNKKLKFQELKLKKENEANIDTITNLELEMKKINNKLLGVTNERENDKRQLIDFKKEVKVLRRERDNFLKIVKENNLL